MVKKQTASGGRSSSNRKSTSRDSEAEKKPKKSRPTGTRSTATPKTRASSRKTSSTKSSTARKDPKNTKKSPAPKNNPDSKQASPRKRSTPPKTGPKSSATKPRRRVTKRPTIAKQPGLMQRLLPRLRAAFKTAQNPAFWRQLIQKLPPWIDEVGAILLIVMGVVMLTALLNTTSEAMLSVNLSRILRQIFGYGAYFVALAILGTGIIILLPKFGIRLTIGWTRIIAIEGAFAAFTALLHLLANDPEAHALAREGGGGGFLGWTLMEATSSLVGNTLSILFYGLILVAGLIIATGLRAYHLTLVVTWLRARLQRSINHLDSLSFEPEWAPEGESEYEYDDPAYSPEDSFETDFDDFQARTYEPNSPTAPPLNNRPSIVPRDAQQPGRTAPGSVMSPPARPKQNPRPDSHPEPESGDVTKNTGNNPQAAAKSNGKTPPSHSKSRPLSKEERKALVDKTREELGAANGRSLVAPGEPGARESVVPRDFLPDARVVPAAPRARIRRKPEERIERHFTVEDFREVKKVGKRDSDLPDLDLLTEIELDKPTEDEINTNARIIRHTLMEFDVETEVIDVNVGPTVTQYAVSPYTEQITEEGEHVLNRVRVSEITNLNGDLALALSAKRLRIQAPVPGHSYVGIEVPNRQPSTVALRPVLESEHFYKYRDRSLILPLGRDVSGVPFIADLATMPHLLIAGTTGSGKSIMLAAMTTAFVMNNLPDMLQLVLLDPKMVELSRFNGLPHLLGPVETELDRIIGVLRWATREMDRRYKLLEKEAARNLETFNRSLGRRRKHERLPYIVIVIDEIGDLMMQRPDETERALTRLAQMARAVGIHLMVATQRPSVDVITGLIKANFPARVSFAVASGVDSRVILDSNGAETLLGRGDMLFLAPDASGPQRIQGCYVSDEEVNAVVDYWKQWHREKIETGEMEPPAVAPWERGMTRREVLAETDPILEEAIALVIAEGEASASLIQRRLGLGYPRAARIMDLLFELGIVGSARPGGRTREVLVKPGADPFKRIVDKRLDNKK